MTLLTKNKRFFQKKQQSNYKVITNYNPKCFYQIIKFNRFNIVSCQEENGPKTLEEILEERKKDSNYLQEDEILNYFSRILQQVKEVHNRNIVCGNLMPNNIILIKKLDLNEFDYNEYNEQKMQEKNNPGQTPVKNERKYKEGDNSLKNTKTHKRINKKKEKRTIINNNKNMGKTRLCPVFIKDNEWDNCTLTILYIINRLIIFLLKFQKYIF